MSIFEAPQYIPAEIISELESKFGSLDFTNYGTIDDETSSRKLDYRLVEELDPSVSGMMVAMSPDDCQPYGRHYSRETHQAVTMYFVRMNEPNDIRSVRTSGVVMIPREPDKWEPDPNLALVPVES